jgi:hypothetical protein
VRVCSTHTVLRASSSHSIIYWHSLRINWLYPSQSTGGRVRTWMLTANRKAQTGAAFPSIFLLCVSSSSRTFVLRYGPLVLLLRRRHLVETAVGCRKAYPSFTLCIVQHWSPITSHQLFSFPCDVLAKTRRCDEVLGNPLVD